ncbi:hypothetical protein CLOM_g12040 [Closterium sp. NIES-68]|nr:hypothetical protein CLOM_g12040 [Closterium sp. NIES-68]GJP68950.1 hypothetical protein CLOP_g25585 [Closterium sp. NIES-67]
MSRRYTYCLASLIFLCTFLCLISAKSQPQAGIAASHSQRAADTQRRHGGFRTPRFSPSHRTLLVDTPSAEPAARNEGSGLPGEGLADQGEESYIVRAEPVPKRILRVASPEPAQRGRRQLNAAEGAAAERGGSGKSGESGESRETWTEAEEQELVIPKGVAFYHRGKNRGGDGGSGGGSGGAGTRLAAPVDITPSKRRNGSGGQASGGSSNDGAGKFPVISPGGSGGAGGGGGSSGGTKKKRGGPNGGWTLAKERRVSFSSAQEMKIGNGQFGKGGKVTYHGGPVMARSPIKVYLIFYGDWDKTTVDLFHKFVSSISGKYKTPKDRYNVTRWWGLTAAGTQADGKRVSATVALGKSVLDRNYVSGGGKVLRNYQKDVVAIINYHLRAKLLPFDTDGIYMVMTDPTVEVKSSDPRDGFCTRFCGYHSYGQDALGKALKFGFAGHSARCPSQCTRPLPYDTFNGVNVDATLSTFAHEIAEVAQDPLFTAWYDYDQVEGADKCTYVYGDGWVNPRNSAAYNLMGRRGSRFLIQSMWSLDKQMCVQ